MDNQEVAGKLVRIAKSLIGGFGVGDSIENGDIRAHRWQTAIQVWDLTNAGKRGKRVDRISIYNLDYVERDPEAQKIVDKLAADISRAKKYIQVEKFIRKALDDLKEFKYGTSVSIEEGSERGVDVAPGNFKKIKISGKHVYVEANYKTFVVRDKDDKYNLPTCIPAVRGGKADIKVFYRWVQDNESKIKGMTFHEVMEGMGKAGVRYHYYCAMD